MKVAVYKKLLQKTKTRKIKTKSHYPKTYRKKPRNKKQDISGFLFYKDGTYLQLLEGEFEKVNALFYKIVKDPRHKNVTVLLENKIDHAIFNDYESGFLVPKDKNQYQKLNNYLNYLKLLENNEIDCTISILGSVISKM